MENWLKFLKEWVKYFFYCWNLDLKCKCVSLFVLNVKFMFMDFFEICLFINISFINFVRWVNVDKSKGLVS